MKKIVFFGDSITDMNRDRNEDNGCPPFCLGVGYPNFVAGELGFTAPNEYDVVNRGISGNRVVDLYARIKADVWNLEPDVLSILIGVNDVWHEIEWGRNGVDIERYEKVYRMLLEDTKARFPQMKILLCEPFVLRGLATSATEERWERFCEVREYAKVVKKLADEYGAYFVPLQDTLDALAEKNGAETYLYDGVHPSATGAKLIASEWLKVFEKAVK